MAREWGLIDSARPQARNKLYRLKFHCSLCETISRAGLDQIHAL